MGFNFDANVIYRDKVNPFQTSSYCIESLEEKERTTHTQRGALSAIAM